MKDTYSRDEPIPKVALWLGIAGVLPFAWGALTIFVPELFTLGQNLLGQRFVGPYVQVFYGTIILAFMSGALWGFASKLDTRRGAIFYALSVIPALWAFFMVGGGADKSLFALIIGFVGLLAIDAFFARYGLTPGWWMRLRQALTLAVVACLALGLFA